MRCLVVGVQVERLRRMVRAEDGASVWALAVALRRRGDGWGEALDAASQGDWARARAALEEIGPQGWDADLEALARALLDEVCPVRTASQQGLCAAARGGRLGALRLVTAVEVSPWGGVTTTPAQIAGAGADGWARLLGCPDLAWVRSLKVTLTGPAPGLWGALLDSPWLAEVEVLSLTAHPPQAGMSDAEGAALVGLRWRRLHTLALRGHQVGAATARALIDHPTLGASQRLRALDLSQNPLPAAQVLGLLDAPCVRALEALSLPTPEPLSLCAHLTAHLDALPDAALRYALAQLDPDQTPRGALPAALGARLVPWLDRLIDDAQGRYPTCYEAARLLRHLCASGDEALRAHLQALPADDLRRLTARAFAPAALSGWSAWGLYGVWSRAPLTPSERAEDLLRALTARPSSISPLTTRPGEPPKPFLCQLLDDLCALPLPEAAAARRLATVRAFSAGDLSDATAAAAVAHLLTLDPASAPTITARLRAHLATPQAHPDAVIALSKRLDLPADGLRPLAFQALSAKSARLRRWGFTTLGTFDTYDALTRATLLRALTHPDPSSAAPFLLALKDGWLPRCRDALRRDRLRPQDLQQHPTLRPYRLATLADALDAA